MNAKEVVKKGYELFGKGDMEGFMEMVHDDITWIYPGDKHPMSGTHKGKEAYMKTIMQVPNLWSNFSVTPDMMISEGNKVFVKATAKADGMDTIFGHYFEVGDDGKLTLFIAFDDTLSMFNAIKK